MHISLLSGTVSLLVLNSLSSKEEHAYELLERP